jgi:CheY-like chemotaxis protein
MARVLIADDDKDLLASAGRLLQEAGYEVVVAASGADALCMLSAKPPPDVLLLDMAMPVMDGHAVLKTLGPTAPPVVVITGAVMWPDDFACGKVVRVLPKPFGAKLLLKAISDAIGTTDSAFSPPPLSAALAALKD